MRYSNRYLYLVVAIFAVFSAGQVAANPNSAAEKPETPTVALEKLLGEVIRGGEWRTPNPDYKPGENAPTHYSTRYSWGPYKQHVTGELVGIFKTDEGEKEIRFWTLYAFYNPVIRKAEAYQIGWNGSIATGSMYRNADGNLQIEQTFFGVDGSEKDMKHEEKMDKSGDWFMSDVFEKNAAGNWVEARDWIWTKHSKR